MSTYVPKPDPEGINAPPGTPLKDLAILVAGFLGVVAVLFVSAGFLSEWILTRLDLETEKKIFSQLLSPLHDQQKAPDALKNLMQRLTVHTKIPLTISVSCDSEPNAYAVPGGLILVTQGLFRHVQSENGLAFVLGHEIGHFVHRDHMRGLSRQLSFVTLRALLGFDIQSVAGLDELQLVLSRSFDRGQESQADAFALRLLQSVYGHTKGADEFFVSLTKEKTWVDSVPAVFLTHPHSEARIQRIRDFSPEAEGEPVVPEPPLDRWIDETPCASTE